MPERFLACGGPFHRPAHPVNGSEGAEQQRAWVQELLNPACYPHPVARVTVLETHISYVLLTGQFAYKIKKIVDLGFLDFSRIDQRRFYCEEELLLNQRLAPRLYLGVVPVSLARAGLRVGDAEAPVEYAVKMREFPQEALLDQRLVAGELTPSVLDRVAEEVAGFHARVARAAVGAGFGSPAAVWAPLANCLNQLRAHATVFDSDVLKRVEEWCHAEYGRLEGFFAARQAEGFIREGHGDLHLGNMAWVGGEVQIFDGIEFDPNLRWIDVMNEIAFLCMDLEARGRPDYAQRFLNCYLEITGDYDGVRCLPFYRVYRALVRAMVAAIRADQDAADPGQAVDCARYLDCARRASLPRNRLLFLMHGVSGAGKTWVSQIVLEQEGGLRVRSDLERKRLAGLSAQARSGSALNEGLYAAKMTEATYARLRELARRILEAGFPVVVDAASLLFEQRQAFRGLAQALNIPFRILSCQAVESVLHRRLLAREADGQDASEAGMAVLEHQLACYEPLRPEEQEETVDIDSAYDTPGEILARIGAAGTEF